MQETTLLERESPAATGSVRNDWTREEIAALFDLPFTELVFRAAEVHRAHHRAGEVQLCTLLSIKTGGCPEDCGYCSQSVKADSGVEATKLMEVQAVLQSAAQARDAGSKRFCMGAAWRNPKERDMPAVIAMIKGVREMGLETCMTLGMLTPGQADQLAEAGLDYYNHNIDTSPERYGEVITTRTFADRLQTLDNVRNAGINVCSGGIVGMGETRADRVGFVHALASMEQHPESVPVNALVPVKGTVLGNMLADTPLAKIDDIEFVRTVAVARITMPLSMVRLSAGRESMSEATQSLCFMAGANSIFTGDKLLTAANAGDDADAAMFARLGLKPMEGEEPLRAMKSVGGLFGRLRGLMADASTRTGNIWSTHTADLAALGEKARLRSLTPRRGIDFASNDYLAMSSSPRLAKAVQDAIARGVPLGSGGSRLLRGNDPEHEALEEEAARFFGSESALFFSAGYAANVALLSTLPQRGDLIVYDELVHASMHEGLRLTRATALSAAHNDAQSFDDVAREWRAAGNVGRIWLAFETLYSMDGDMAPVAAMAEVAQRHDAVMLIDEAHATGVFGRDGRGLAADLDGRPDTIVLRTCGKALGCEGALVLAPRVVRDFLVNRGRPFIFSTAPSPLVAAAVREAIRMLADEPDRRDALNDLVAQAEQVLGRHGAVATGSQILPLVLHDDARTMAVAAKLQKAGFDVRGIRPPTVPQGTSRLRISLTLNASPDDVDALGAALAEALK